RQRRRSDAGRIDGDVVRRGGEAVQLQAEDMIAVAGQRHGVYRLGDAEATITFTSDGRVEVSHLALVGNLFEACLRAAPIEHVVCVLDWLALCPGAAEQVAACDVDVEQGHDFVEARASQRGSGLEVEAGLPA